MRYLIEAYETPAHCLGCSKSNGVFLYVSKSVILAPAGQRLLRGNTVIRTKNMVCKQMHATIEFHPDFSELLALRSSIRHRNTDFGGNETCYPMYDSTIQVYCEKDRNTIVCLTKLG